MSILKQKFITGDAVKYVGPDAGLRVRFRNNLIQKVTKRLSGAYLYWLTSSVAFRGQFLELIRPVSASSPSLDWWDPSHKALQTPQQPNNFPCVCTQAVITWGRIHDPSCQYMTHKRNRST